MEIWHKRIKELRENSDITLKDMAKIIGVSEATVQRYESGKIHELPYKVIEAYAEKFNVNPSYIMGWQESPGQLSIFDLDKNLKVTRDSINKNFESMYKHIMESNIGYIISDEEKDIVECYRSMSDQEQEMLKRAINYYEKVEKLHNGKDIHRPQE